MTRDELAAVHHRLDGFQRDVNENFKILTSLVEQYHADLHGRVTRIEQDQRYQRLVGSGIWALAIAIITQVFAR